MAKCIWCDSDELVDGGLLCAVCAYESVHHAEGLIATIAVGDSASAVESSTRTFSAAQCVADCAERPDPTMTAEQLAGVASNNLAAVFRALGEASTTGRDARVALSVLDVPVPRPQSEAALPDAIRTPIAAPPTDQPSCATCCGPIGPGTGICLVCRSRWMDLIDEAVGAAVALGVPGVDHRPQRERVLDSLLRAADRAIGCPPPSDGPVAVAAVAAESAILRLLLAVPADGIWATHVQLVDIELDALAEALDDLRDRIAGRSSSTD